MKKMFLGLTAFAALGLVACGGNQPAASSAPAGTSHPTGLSTPEQSGYSEEVKALPTGKVLSVAGPGKVIKDGAPVALDWAITDNGLMTAASVKAVADFAPAIANQLAGKNIDALYTLSNVVLGSGDAGWNAKVLVDGEVKDIDGSFAVKAIIGSFDAEDEVYITEQWIPDPHTAHVQNLSTDTLFIAENWAETADAHGFDWTANPIAYVAGTYTLVVAQYAEASSETVFGYGMGLVKTGDLPTAIS